MKNNNVVSLQKVGEVAIAAIAARAEALIYQEKVLQLNKVELLEEMIRFQEERTKVGHLTLEMIAKGQILFKVIEEKAELMELRSLASTYSKHLALEALEVLKPQAQ